MQKLVYLTVEFNDTNIQNIGKTIEEAISNSTELSEDEKTILLEYPVVYIHTWKNAGKTSVYVGETTNVIRRSEEHIRISDDPYSFDNVWQKNWKDEDSRERFSFFFIS